MKKYLINICLFFMIFSIGLGNNKDIFYLGLQDYPETEQKVNGKSLNDLIKEIFTEELHLNVQNVKGDWITSFENLKEGKVGALGLVTKRNLDTKDILLSNSIFSENLYIVSNKKILNSPSDLDNHNIYVQKNDSIALKYLNRFKKKYNLSLNIIKVNHIEKYRDEYTAESSLTADRFQNKLLVSYYSPVSIGINKKYSYLLPKINEILKNKYGKKIIEHENSLIDFYQRERFEKLLTPQEKQWIENNNYIRTAFEDDLSLSMYIKSKKLYIGILPQYMNKISKIIGIKIETEKNYSNESWNNLLKELKDGEIDCLSLTETNARRKDFIFSTPVDFIPMSLVKHKYSNNFTLGVLSGGISEVIGREFFLPGDIRVYNSTESLYKDFKDNKIGYILSPNGFFELGCSKEHGSINITQTPITFAFKKDNIILRSIFNKAISVIGEYEKTNIRDLVVKKQKEHLIQIEKEKNKVIYIQLIMGTVGIILLILLLVRLWLQKKMNHILKYDPLTGLPNRHLFKKTCKNKNLEKNLVIVIDLDNFKQANDNHGHTIGDFILVEVGKILMNIFKKNEIFRISGDEFYIISKDYDNEEYLIEEILRKGKDSEILSKYKISFSIGFYIKKTNENLEQALVKADEAMYQGKKIKGFSAIKYKEK
ncbi:diguanylate cyclase domain-containing protein [Cetobacterium sp. SF1]|uniref:diguanylate cyclase domain-containing protein n=1 Tax=Cetobacterium sp. SF1 TaxID=3417654 RepID=UPI003CF691CD